MLAREAIDLVQKLLHSKEFLFWWDWILRLPPRADRRDEQPVSPVDKDQKEWSHLTQIRRFAVGRDASNKTYFCCVTILAHSIEGMPDRWKRLSDCVLSYPVADGYFCFLKYLLVDFFTKKKCLIK